jgi:hypothetical protein
MEEEPFSTLARGAESNPARVLLWQSVARQKIFIFSYIKIDRHTLSGETHDLPAQIIQALNQEGVELVELTFNQSYRSELTTNPLGKHYINS